MNKYAAEQDILTYNKETNKTNITKRDRCSTSFYNEQTDEHNYIMKSVEVAYRLKKHLLLTNWNPKALEQLIKNVKALSGQTTSTVGDVLPS